jgi:hypothetical protein
MAQAARVQSSRELAASLTRVLCCYFAPMSRCAPPRAPTLMFIAPDGTQHALDLCNYSSEDDAAAGGP